jgi:hypothetical protein
VVEHIETDSLSLRLVGPAAVRAEHRLRRCVGLITIRGKASPCLVCQLFVIKLKEPCSMCGGGTVEREEEEGQSHNIVHSESIQTPSLVLCFVTLQPYSKMEQINVFLINLNTIPP